MNDRRQARTYPQVNGDQVGAAVAQERLQATQLDTTDNHKVVGRYNLHKGKRRQEVGPASLARLTSENA